MNEQGRSGRPRPAPSTRDPNRRAKQKQPKRPRAPMPPGHEARRPRSRPDVTLADPSAGRGLVQASLAGSALLFVTAVAAAIDLHAFQIPALVVAIAMFLGGTAAFIWAYAIAIGRSRTDDVSLLGVYGLVDTTPAPVKVRLFGSLVAEVAIALATAGVRLYSTLSFGVLAVMWGLGLAGAWGARYGAFPPREPDPPRRRGKSQ